MYKAKANFVDQMKDRYQYKVGDAYEEISPIWTKYLEDNGMIEKVSFEKKKYEIVQEKQD